MSVGGREGGGREKAEASMRKNWSKKRSPRKGVKGGVEDERGRRKSRING